MTLGAAGYIHALTGWPREAVIVVVVLGLGLVAAWGILESVVVAAVFTVLEVGGLLMVILAAAGAGVPFGAAIVTLPPADLSVLSGIAAASLIAFFAFIGFEDLANVAEEAQEPHRTLPLAMVLTLIIATVLYVVVAAVAVTAVPPAELAASEAPLSLVFQRLAGTGPVTLGLIAIVATLNTVLAQMTMATRVVYGMARQGDLPARERRCGRRPWSGSRSWSWPSASGWSALPPARPSRRCSSSPWSMSRCCASNGAASSPPRPMSPCPPSCRRRGS